MRDILDETRWILSNTLKVIRVMPSACTTERDSGAGALGDADRHPELPHTAPCKHMIAWSLAGVPRISRLVVAAHAVPTRSKVRTRCSSVGAQGDDQIRLPENGRAALPCHVSDTAAFHKLSCGLIRNRVCLACWKVQGALLMSVPRRRTRRIRYGDSVVECHPWFAFHDPSLEPTHAILRCTTPNQL